MGQSATTNKKFPYSIINSSMPHPPEIATTLHDLMKLEHMTLGKGILPKRTVHSILAGKNASKLRGRGLDFEEVRKYVQGDDIRNIDWRVTARTKVTHTKVFNEEKERPVFTIVDQSSFMFFGSQVYTKSVIAAQAAAIGAFRTLKVGDRFGGIIFGDQQYEQITARRSRVAVMRFLEKVVAYNRMLPHRKKVASNLSPLNEMLKRAHIALTHDYVVTVISDLSHANEETFRHLINLALHNDLILVNITDPMEFHLPEIKLPVGDGDHQVMLADRQKIREKFHAQVTAVFEDHVSRLKKYGIPVMQINTAQPLIDQIKKIFAKR